MKIPYLMARDAFYLTFRPPSDERLLVSKNVFFFVSLGNIFWTYDKKFVAIRPQGDAVARHNHNRKKTRELKVLK